MLARNIFLKSARNFLHPAELSGPTISRQFAQRSKNIFFDISSDRGDSTKPFVLRFYRKTREQSRSNRERKRVSPLFYGEQSSYQEACAKFVEDDKPFSRQIRLQRGANVSTFLRRRVFGQVTELSSHEQPPFSSPQLARMQSVLALPFSRFLRFLSLVLYIYMYIYELSNEMQIASCLH